MKPIVALFVAMFAWPVLAAETQPPAAWFLVLTVDSKDADFARPLYKFGTSVECEQFKGQVKSGLESNPDPEGKVNAWTLSCVRLDYKGPTT